MGALPLGTSLPTVSVPHCANPEMQLVTDSVYCNYLVNYVGQDRDYMAQSDDERVQNMQDVDKLAELLSATR